MQNFPRPRYLLLSLIVAVVILVVGIQTTVARTTSPVGNLEGSAALLPTGQFITPTAAPSSTFTLLGTDRRSDGNAAAAQAVTTALSPDGKTLLVLTSGYNQNFNDEQTGEEFTYPVLDPQTGQPGEPTADPETGELTEAITPQAEWVFVFDVSSGKLVKQQQINIPNTYVGLTWAPDGKRFYVSAGIDDRVYVYAQKDKQYVPDAPFILLGHNSDQASPFPEYDGGLLQGTAAQAVAAAREQAVATGATVAGLATSADGKTLVAANFQNDSISLIDPANRQVLQEIRFFVPGGEVATGEFPFDVAIANTKQGAAAKVFVSSQRDNEVLAVDVASQAITRIPVGSQPNKILLSADERMLFVANGNSDTVSVIDTASDRLVQTISLSRPGDKYKGANPNSLALSPDNQTLYVTLGGENAIAVVDLGSRRPKGQVVGRIPTGWYPNSVSVSQDGKTLYVVNAKDNAGPNPSNGRTTEAGEARNTTFRNEYNWALEKASISAIPVPNRGTLAALTRQVDQNNGFDNRRPDPMMAFLRTKIKHVIYVVKENRTYDQVLGDLPVGNGDPELTLFPQPISPNHHQLSLGFATFDNFYNPGESSGVGWDWSTYARTTDYTEKAQAVLYGNANFNGLTYDYEGTNRNINLALPQTSTNPTPINTRVTGLLDPNGSSSILPGQRDISAPAGDGELNPNAVGGYLWDAVLRTGKTVRNYGFFIDLAYYGTSLEDPTQPDPENPFYIPITPTPFADNIPQAPVTKSALQDKTDIYFRGYDQKHPDIYLYNEWARDIDAYIKQNNDLPNLSLVRLHHDHFGDFDNAVAGLNTAELQMADNDYAVGLLVEKISKSPYWKDTAIFVIEDDCQDGPDHVDGHRSVAYVISPYTQRGVLVNTNYTTVNVLRTIEDLLGTDYLAITDANAQPMSDAFTRTPDLTPYTAIVPGNLCQAPVDPNLVPACQNPHAVKTTAIPSRHNQQWWAQVTKNFNFAVEDKLDANAFNRLLWAGIKGEDVPYVAERNRQNLRQNRNQLVATTTK